MKGEARKSGLRAACCAFLLLLGAVSAPAAPPVRLAVISTAATADLAALVAAEMSAKPEFTLVERDDLAKIGDERELQKLAGNDGVALGRLVGADGLLFLDGESNGLHIRFTAVGLGYALFDERIGPGTDLPQLAKSLSHRIASYVPKLRLDPAKAIPLSILNLRADYATPASTVLERRLTLLLESRLASLPEYVVLERRHAWPLGFERSLSDPSPLARGIYFVDGMLSLKGKEAVIRLRLREPDSREMSLEITGPADDLHGLVEKMVEAIRKATGNPAQAAAWDSQKEAREYFLEGLWGWQNKVDAAALEALDSAELLGENSPDFVPLRIDVLLRSARRGVEQNERGAADAPTPDQLIDYTLRAISDAVRYEKNGMEQKLTRLAWQRYPEVRTGQIKENLASFTSSLLVFLESREAARADELRTALRSITGYDPLNGKLGLLDFSNPANVLIDSEGQWDLTLEEQLAYCRLLCTLPNQYLPPEFLTGKGEGFCRRFLKTPEEQKAAYERFVADLEKDPKGQWAWQLIRSCSSNPAEADEAYSAFWREMWKRRESLVSQKVQVQEWTSSRPVPEALRQKHAKEMIPLLRYYLTHVNNYRYWENSLETMWQPEEWSEAEAAAILADYLEFKQRAEQDRLARNRNPIDFARFEKPLQRRFPGLVPERVPKPVQAPLMVRRLWHPWLDPETPMVRMYVNAVMPRDGSLWTLVEASGLEKERYRIFRLSLPDFKARRIPVPEVRAFSLIEVDSNAIHALYHDPSQPDLSRLVGRFDLKTEQWEARNLDINFYKCRVLDDVLYFGLEGSGIGRYDWRDGTFALLASSRRRPAQNQFDDSGNYQVHDVFKGPGGRPCLVTAKGTYFIRDEPGDWPEVFDASWGMRSRTDFGRTLVYSPDGEAVLLDPERAEPVFLMAPLKASYRKVVETPQQAVKRMAPWAGQTPWDPVENIGLGGKVGTNGDWLFVVRQPDETRDYYDLTWYDRKHGRKPRRIPLQFVLDPKTRARLAPLFQEPKGERYSLDSLERPGGERFGNFFVDAVEDGICFTNGDVGIWFLSHREIDDYLKTHAAGVSETAPPPIQSIRIPPREEDAESRVIGDMIDPARADGSFR